MKNPTKTFLKAAALAAFLVNSASAQTVYTEDFEGFAAGTEFLKGTAFYTLLYNGDDNAYWDVNFSNANNVKTLDYEGGSAPYWATTTGPIERFNNGILQPQVGTNADLKAVGVFLAPSVFTAGSGNYQLSYDVVGVDPDSEERSAAVQVATFSGIGADAANTVGIDLAGPEMFTETETYPSVTDSRFRTQGTATLVNYVAQSVDTTVAGTFTLNFTYSEGETVGLVFNGYGTDVQFDNLSIAVAQAPTEWAGYPRRPDGYVDTTPFLGWIWVSDATDYVWCINLNKYIYLPEEFVSESGAWSYFPN